MTDRKTFKRIAMLMKDIQRHPFDGIGKPEPLRENLSGYWSRRINARDRLVYSVENDKLKIISLKYHYGK